MANCPDRLRGHNIAEPVVDRGVKGRERLKRIPAQMHRCGACVVLLTFECDAHVTDTNYVRDDPDLFTGCVEPRTLFDVQLDESCEAGRIDKGLRIAGKYPACIAKGDASVIRKQIGVRQTDLS